MPDNQPNPTPSAGEQSPTRSLREIAEDAYDQVESDAGPDDGDDGGSQQPVDDGGRARDEYGRFVAKDRDEPGEAAPHEGEPSPEIDSAPQPESPTQPAQAVSSEAPANWSAQDRETFRKLPQEARDFLQRRHSEMEGEFQRRVQAVGAAAQFTEALAPVFSDPIIQGSLQQTGLAPVQAIEQWAAMHKRAYHPDPRERMNLLVDIAQNVGLNPAAIFQTSRPVSGPPPALSETDLQDPAIRYFAETIGQTSNEVQALRGELQRIRQAEQQSAQQQALKVTRWGIDSFAEEKGQDGKPLHPYFDRVMDELLDLYRADPKRDLTAAYHKACRMNEAVWNEIQAAQAARVTQQQANQRAAQAARLNIRSRTSPVSKPNGSADGKPLSLRDTIEASAEDIGF